MNDGRLSPEERADILLADFVIRGRPWKQPEHRVWLRKRLRVLEVSADSEPYLVSHLSAFCTRQGTWKAFRQPEGARVGEGIAGNKHPAMGQSQWAWVTLRVRQSEAPTPVSGASFNTSQPSPGATFSVS